MTVGGTSAGWLRRAIWAGREPLACALLTVAALVAFAAPAGADSRFRASSCRRQRRTGRGLRRPPRTASSASPAVPGSTAATRCQQATPALPVYRSGVVKAAFELVPAPVRQLEGEAGPRLPGRRSGYDRRLHRSNCRRRWSALPPPRAAMLPRPHVSRPPTCRGRPRQARPDVPPPRCSPTRRQAIRAAILLTLS
jgi:hypothetical protein